LVQLERLFIFERESCRGKKEKEKDPESTKKDQVKIDLVKSGTRL